MFQRIFSLARHTAIYGLGDLLGRAIAVILVPIYARYLSPADNGVASLAFAFIGVSAVFYSLGLNPALVRVLSGQKDLSTHRTAFSSAFWTLLTLALVLSGLCVLGSDHLSQLFLDNQAQSRIFKLIAGILLLDTLSEPLFTVCRAQQKSLQYAVVRFIQYALQLGLTAYFIASLNRGPEAIFEANAISSLFALLIMLPTAVPLLRPVFNPRDVRQLLAFGLPFLPASLSILIINLSDRFLIRYILGLDELGIYGIVYKLGLPIFFVVKAFRAAWAPAVLDTDNASEAQQMCARITTYFSVTGLFLCLVMATFSQELIGLIAGENAPAYLPGAPVVPLVALSFFAYGLYVILTAGVYAKGNAKSLPIIVGIGAVVNIAINIVFLPTLGFVAAAYSTLVAYGIMVVLLFFSVRQFYPVSYEFARLGKVGVTASIVFLAMSRYLHDTSQEGIIARGIFLIGYPLILWGWHFFEPGELRHLRTTLQGMGVIKKRVP